MAANVEAIENDRGLAISAVEFGRGTRTLISFVEVKSLSASDIAAWVDKKLVSQNVVGISEAEPET